MIVLYRIAQSWKWVTVTNSVRKDPFIHKLSTREAFNLIVDDVETRLSN